MELLLMYLLIGLALFALGLARTDETVWIGFRAVPELFVFQGLTFMLVWPVLLAFELSRR